MTLRNSVSAFTIFALSAVAGVDSTTGDESFRRPVDTVRSIAIVELQYFEEQEAAWQSLLARSLEVEARRQRVEALKIRSEEVATAVRSAEEAMVSVASELHRLSDTYKCAESDLASLSGMLTEIDHRVESAEARTARLGQRINSEYEAQARLYFSQYIDTIAGIGASIHLFADGMPYLDSEDAEFFEAQWQVVAGIQMINLRRATPLEQREFQAAKNGVIDDVCSIYPDDPEAKHIREYGPRVIDMLKNIPRTDGPTIGPMPEVIPSPLSYDPRCPLGAEDDTLGNLVSEFVDLITSEPHGLPEKATSLGRKLIKMAKKGTVVELVKVIATTPLRANDLDGLRARKEAYRQLQLWKLCVEYNKTVTRAIRAAQHDKNGGSGDSMRGGSAVDRVDLRGRERKDTGGGRGSDGSGKGDHFYMEKHWEGPRSSGGEPASNRDERE